MNNPFTLLTNKIHAGITGPFLIYLSIKKLKFHILINEDHEGL